MAHRKRSWQESEEDSLATKQFGVGETLSRLRDPEHHTDLEHDSSKSKSVSEDEAQPDKKEWQVVEGRATKKQKKIPKKESTNYPVITHSSSARLQTHVRISDLQSLVLYVLADGPAPQWAAVRHHGAIRKVVVLMVPGLEPGMFNGSVSLEKISSAHEINSNLAAGETIKPTDNDKGNLQPEDKKEPPKAPLSPDDYYPSNLDSDKLPEALKPLAEMFPHVWPIKAPGDDRYNRLHSPLQAMLTAPFPKMKGEKKMKGAAPPREAKTWQNQRTPITEFIANFDQLQENEYVLHPAQFRTAAARAEALAQRLSANQSTNDGWINIEIQELEDGDVPEFEQAKGDLTAGRDVMALDCEMCKTDADTFELTRISLISWDESVILDELVKPERPIVDYLTPYVILH